jgi:hypothetical protein
MSSTLLSSPETPRDHARGGAVLSPAGVSTGHGGGLPEDEASGSQE